MKGLPGLLLVGAVFTSCGVFQPAPPKPQMSVRESVIRSWNGVELIVLERHPWFSYRQPQVRTLSDGTETWVYSSCRSQQAGRSGSYTLGQAAVGNSSATAWEECCHSQFFIRGGAGGAKQVVEYRPSRFCVLDCTVAAGGCRQ